jgi:hypothetical protein
MARRLQGEETVVGVPRGHRRSLCLSWFALVSKFLLPPGIGRTGVVDPRGFLGIVDSLALWWCFSSADLLLCWCGPAELASRRLWPCWEPKMPISGRWPHQSRIGAGTRKLSMCWKVRPWSLSWRPAPPMCERPAGEIEGRLALQKQQWLQRWKKKPDNLEIDNPMLQVMTWSNFMFRFCTPEFAKLFWYFTYS